MPKGNLREEQRTRSIIGCFFRAYNQLGFGFLETLCCEALQRELVSAGHSVAREVNVPVYYQGHRIGVQRLDMIVDGKIVVEIKSAALLFKSPTRQLYNYLRATKYEVGLFFHFGKEPNFERVFCPNSKKMICSESSGSHNPDDAEIAVVQPRHSDNHPTSP